jgi:hypothetical protein
MNRKATIIAHWLFLLISSTAMATDDVWIPLPGSAERMQILDVARNKVAIDMKRENGFKFIVDDLRVSGNWAFLIATPVTDDLSPIELDCANADGEMDHTVATLLKRTRGTWEIIEGGVVCAGDAFWMTWHENLRGTVPDGIFPDTTAP